MAQQLRGTRGQIRLAGLRHLERMNAQRVAVATGVRQRSHGIEVADFYGGQHAMHDLQTRSPLPHRRDVGGKLSGVEVAVAVDPVGHTGKIP